MFYILDNLGYIEATSSHYIECDNKTCTEYKGAIPDGYDSLDDWVLNANIRAYKIDTSGNLAFDSAREAALQEEYAKKCYVDNQVYSTDELLIGTWIDGKPLYQRTYEITTTTTDTRQYLGSIGLTNIKNAWINESASFVRYSENTDRGIQGVNTFLSTNDYKNCYIDSGQSLTLKTGSAMTLYWTITLRYTKTTD